MVEWLGVLSMSSNSSHRKATLLTCGVELEFEVKPKPFAQSMYSHIFDRVSSDHPELLFAEIIDAALSEQGNKFEGSCLGVHSIPYQKAVKDNSIHGHWKVMMEAIPPVHDSENWVVELCSPVLYPQQEAWFEGVERVWDIIQLNFSVFTNPGCGTHVHVKQIQRPSTSLQAFVPNAVPVQAGFEPYYTPDLRAVAKAIVYWEHAIAMCIPPARRFASVAISNTAPSRRQYPRTQAMQDFQCLESNARQMTFGTLFDKIDRFATAESLIEYIGGLKMKNLAWNFAHMKDGEINTIEFRRPPMATSVQATLHWLTLTASFVASATRFDFLERSAEYTAPTRSALESSYLKLGLQDIMSGQEFLKIDELDKDIGANTQGPGAPSGSPTASNA